MGNEGKSNESYRILWLSNSMADDTNGVHCPMCESGGAPAGGVVAQSPVQSALMHCTIIAWR